MKQLLIGFLLFCSIFAACSEAALNTSYDCLSQDIGASPALSFCLPPGTNVSAEENDAMVYDWGRDVSTTLAFSSGNINVHLLYPIVLEAALSEDDIKDILEEFMPEMEDAFYEPVAMNVSGQIAVSGEIADQDGGQTFVAFQPGMSMLAVVFFDQGLSPEIEPYFLRTLDIQTNEVAMALTPTDASEALSPAAMVQPPAGVTGQPFSNPSSSHIDQIMKDSGPGAEARTERLGAAMEQMAADREAAYERLGQAKENLAA